MLNTQKWKNWSSSFESTPDVILYPTTEEEILAVVTSAIETKQTVKVVGSGHSWSKIGQTKGGYLLNLKAYNKILSCNSDTGIVTVQAGASLEEIAKFALENNLAFDNLGTIVVQSIAGAIATGTHGSGVTHGSLDQSILAFTVITANGTIKTFDKEVDVEKFNTAVVGLGALGIVSTVTLKLVPNYNLKITTKSLSFDEMLANIPKALTDDYMRFWWVPHVNKVQYWEAHKTTESTSQQNSFNNWYTDLFLGNFVHELGLWFTSFFKKKVPALNNFMFQKLLSKEGTYTTDFLDAFTLPIKVKQKVMEYGVPFEATESVLKKIEQLLKEKKYNVHMPIEVRFAPENNAALSMAHGRLTCYIGIIAYQPFGKVPDYDAYFKDVHTIFAAHAGRPHWAKATHYTKDELVSLYPKWQEFSTLRTYLDPKGMFMNDFLKRLF
ncbi:D-arabinono-1,4-lactone oxidase [Wenyingzhuangia sp. IMCC45574]